MTGEFRHGHYLLGIEGLALLRAGARRSFDELDARVEEIREILSGFDEPPYSERRDLPEADVEAGYGRWAEDYDEPGNDTIAAEEPVVRELLDRLPPGPVLDAAGLAVRRCIEPRLSAAQAKARAKQHSVDAFEDALTGVPAVIVWEAERLPE